MSAQSRAVRRWPVGRIELEAAASRNPLWISVLMLEFVCAAAFGIARSLLGIALSVAQPADRPLQLVLRYVRRFPRFSPFAIAPFAAAYVKPEAEDAKISPHRVAVFTHNSFPPGFVQFFASFAAVSCR